MRNAGYDTIIVFAGVTDLNSSSSADSIFQSLRTIYDDALAHGVNVVCIGVSPWAQYKTWTVERHTQTTRLNDLISQYVTAHPATARYIDAYTLLGSSDLVVRLKPSMDSGDGRHLSPVGAERLAQAVSTAVLGLDTPTRVEQSLTLTFSRPVFGLSEAPLKLTYFGNPEPAKLVQLDSTRYRVDFSVRTKSFSAMQFNLDLTQGP